MVGIGTSNGSTWGAMVGIGNGRTWTAMVGIGNGSGIWTAMVGIGNGIVGELGSAMVGGNNQPKYELARTWSLEHWPSANIVSRSDGEE